MKEETHKEAENSQQQGQRLLKRQDHSFSEATMTA
jgi:hypothetical protein